MIFREAADAVVGEKFFRVPDALEDGFELMLLKNGEDLGVSARVSIAADGKVRSLSDEPFDAGGELGMIAQIVIIQHFDGEHGNESD